MAEKHIHVEIEATNICNTRCLHCPHEALSRPYGKMEWDTYRTVMDKVMVKTAHFSVEYAGMGEPLLNPQIYRFIEYVSGKGRTSITTNASALTEANAQKLIDAGLSGMTISFNGSDKTLYELMMGGLNFERAQKNLQQAIQMSRGTRTQVAANVSVTRQTQTRLKEIRGFLEEAGIDNIFFSKCHSRGGFLKDDFTCTTPIPPRDKYRCDIFENTLFVSWTGQVLSCCHDLAGANIIGDLRTESLDEILERKNAVLANGVKFEICKGCNDLYRFMNDPTPDGRPISDWVYNLYASSTNGSNGSNGSAPAASSLSEWLYSLYQTEDQAHAMLQQLSAQVQEKDRQIQALSQARGQEVAVLQAQLVELRSTRSWRLLQRLQKARLALIPQGSRRERIFVRALKLAGF